MALGVSKQSAVLRRRKGGLLRRKGAYGGPSARPRPGPRLAREVPGGEPQPPGVFNEILNPKNTYMSKQTWLVCLQMPGRGRPRASPSTRSPNPCWGEGGSTSYILGRFLLKHLAVKRKHSYTIGVNFRRAGPLHPRILTHPGLSLRKSYNALQFGAFLGGSLDFM